MPPNTDDLDACVVEDLPMPSIWIIVAVAVGALNLRLLVPVIAAFFGVGKYALRA
jgi:hypothetical protein